MAKANGKTKYETKYEAFKDARDKAREWQGKQTLLETERLGLEIIFDKETEALGIEIANLKTQLEVSQTDRGGEVHDRAQAADAGFKRESKRRDALAKELPDLLRVETMGQ